ncbi:MAG: glycosyltransferase, partial [Promethearchaeota archaeon]
MKVLVISHMYPSSFNEISGIFVHEQVKALVSKGIKVQVISPVPWTPFPINYLSSKWKRYSEVTKREIREGINVWYPRYLTFPRAWFFGSSGQRMYLGIKDVVSKIYKEFQFDLIHAHVALPDGYAGMKIAQKYKKTLIVNIHGQDFQQTIFKGKKCKRNIEKVINYSTKTIVVSKKLKKKKKKYLEVNKDKIIVVPNGIGM